MRHRLTTLLFSSILLSGSLSAQGRQKVTHSIGDRFSKMSEVYYVLKDDNTVKDGPYQVLHHDQVQQSGPAGRRQW